MQNKIIEEKLDEYLKTESELEAKIFYQLSLLVYKLNCPENDLHIMAKILPPEHLKNLINYYDGDTMKLPSKEQFHESLMLGITYYLKKIKGMSWTDIKEFLDLPEHNKNLISAISLGGKINKIDDRITYQLGKALKQIDPAEAKKVIKQLKSGNVK
jgi:hypothetical protein